MIHMNVVVVVIVVAVVVACDTTGVGIVITHQRNKTFSCRLGNRHVVGIGLILMYITHRSIVDIIIITTTPTCGTNTMIVWTYQ